MKMALLVLLTFLIAPQIGWITDFETAEKVAVEKHQLILLNFSWSDWCGPCIRLRNEILDSKPFTDFAYSSLVLVNADFPRSNKNKLSKEQVKQNEALADKYNPKGKFPFTLLLDAKGNVLKEWDGLPTVSPTQFTQQAKDIFDANR